MPIHANPIALGFLRFVKERRRSGQLWLPHGVERCPAKGRPSGTFTKTFRRCRIAEGVYNAQRDFHALRTYVHAELKRDGCPSRSAGSSWIRESTTSRRSTMTRRDYRSRQSRWLSCRMHTWVLGPPSTSAISGAPKE